MDPADTPPHEAPMQAVTVPRPIEGSTAHFRAQGRCFAAQVVEVIADDPLSPEFLVDLVVFRPRDRTRKDRFANANTMPGSVRWANDLPHALPDDDGHWKELTWHYPGRHCLPKVVLDGAQSG